MTEAAPPPPAPKPASRAYGRWAAGVLVVAAVLALVAAYAARRALAREALVGWLEARGVPASVEFRDFELGAFAARLRIGPERDADVTAELAEVRYGFTGFWSGEPFGLQVTSVVLHRPVIKASLKGGKLSLGSLDPVIEELARRPPRPDARQPEIGVREGVLRLDTDYGPVQARLNAQLADGRLTALDGKVGATALRGRDLSLLTGPGEIKLVTTRGRVDLALSLPVRRLDVQGLSVSDADLKLSARAPYPDLTRRRADGELSGRLDLTGGRIGLGGAVLRAPRLEVAFAGRAAGAFETLTLRGDAETRLIARAADLAGAKARDLDLILHGHEIRWSRTGGDAVAVNLFAEAKTASIVSGDTQLTQTTAKFQGPGAWAAGVLETRLEGGFATRGAWDGLGAPRRDDPAQTAALKNALRGFRLEAGQVSLHVKGPAVSVDLGAPATALTDTGGQAILAAHGGPLYAAGQGGFRLDIEGGGLPKAELVVPRYRLTSDGLVATAAVKAGGGFGPVEGATLDAAGKVRMASGSTRFAASRCAVLTVRRLDLGENDVEAIDGRICPMGAPMLTLADGGWRLRGRAEGLEAEVPFLEAKVSQTAGLIDFGGAGESLHGRADITSARIDDTAKDRRFAALTASGDATLSDSAWLAAFDIADLAGHGLGQARLRQAADGTGALTLDTGLLTFAPEALQPAQLSPLAAAVGSPASGQARFTGEVAWTREGSASHGVLEVPRLDFLSPAGAVAGLSGRVVFTSLVPLIAAPGQTLMAERVDTLVPLTGAEVSFGIADDILKVEGAGFELGGGKLRLEAIEIPFAPGATWKGVVAFDGVQIADLVESSPFGDRMDMTAKLTGRVPFEVTPQGVRIAGGTLRAIEPGRLSIRREALTVVRSDGGDVAEAPLAAPTVVDPYTDFVYQALEHLTFTELDAKVDSQADGRLGVRFHIKGEHVPPKSQAIKLTLRELFTQKIQRALPLPKGTKVDLTLDTSVNLDQLLDDFARYQALRGSDPVQP